MPTPTEDYQASIDGFLMGAGTNYLFGRNGISGLGNPSAKTAYGQLDGRDGLYGSPDSLNARTIFIRIEIVEDTDTAAFNAFELLTAAWLPTTSNVELHIQLPGLGHRYWDGRPQSVEDDLADFPSGHIVAICEFLALDPFQHTP